MRITRVEMRNFGAFSGQNRLDFRGDGPVVLIGGMNGRGKTTFLEAILAALYGAGSVAFEESKYSSFGQYLKAKTNMADGTGLGAVSVAFILEDGSKVRVERTWDAKKTNVHSDVTVSTPSGVDEFLTANWSSYIEEIVPRALSGFFFFDGEKIADMALDGGDAMIRESIRSLLGVSTVDSLRRDLSTVSRRIGKASSTPVTSEEVEGLGDEVMALKDRIERADADIAAMMSTESSLNRELEILVDDLAAVGGNAMASKAELSGRMAGQRTVLEDIRERQLMLCAGPAPLAMLADRIPDVLDRAEKGYRSEVFEEAVSWLESVACSYGSPEDRKAVAGFLAKAKADIALPGEGFPSAKSVVATLSSLTDVALPAAAAEHSALCSEREEAMEELATVERMIALESDAAAVSETKRSIDEAMNRLSKARVALSEATSARSSLNGEYVRKNAEYKKAYSSYLEGLNAADGDSRTLCYIALADKVFEQYGRRLQQEKVAALSSEITCKFRELANKKSLIGSVTMDPETLEISYWSPEGARVDRALLSAGEKQLMVIATLWALACCSGKKLPVIIDTPLARLDSAHRMSIVRNYFPNAGEQTIILSTDSEIFGEYYDALKPSVSDEYTFVFNDSEHKTTIRRGYFGMGRQ